jgi:hypothetical protein
MKIIIHSLDELLELTALIRGGSSTTKVGAVEHTIKVDASSFDPVKMAQEINDHCATLQGQYEFEQACNRNGEPNGLPPDIAHPAIMSDAEVEANIAAHSRDADGVPHNTDWHSEPAKLNTDGRWRARRKRDENAYKDWLLDQAVGVAEAAVAADVEPVATETHALPQDDGVAHVEAPIGTPTEDAKPIPVDAPTVDFAALVEACQEASLDASDNHMDLIKACQAFISDHGHPAYNALKAAVAPLEGAENGKAVPQFTPAERRLMRACIDKYPTHKEA